MMNTEHNKKNITSITDIISISQKTHSAICFKQIRGARWKGQNQYPPGCIPVKCSL